MSPSISRAFAERTLLVAIIALLSSLPHPLSALAPGGDPAADPQDRDSVTEVPVDLTVNGHPEGFITAEISPRGISLDRARLREVLALTAEGDVLAGVEGKANGKEPAPAVPLAQLDRIGLSFAYDPALLTLSLTVPPERQKPRILRIREPPTALIRKTETPAEVSSYVNIRARSEVVTPALALADPGLAFPSEIEIEPVFNSGGTVFTASVSTSVFSHWDARLESLHIVRDFPQASLRLNAGSLFLPVTGFQSYHPLCGVELIRDAALFSSTATPSPLEGEILVTRPTDMRLSLNNEALWSARLEPGRYRIRDVPLATGVNDLSLTLREGGVVTGSLHELVPFDPRLLAPGESSFSIALGSADASFASGMLSGFFLAGITGNLTAGVNLQAGLDRQMGGLELAVASPLGNLSGGLAVSLGPSLIADFAVLAQYRLSIPAGTALPVISLSAGYAGRGFLLPGATQEANALSWQLSAAYGQALPFGLGMSIGVSYQRWWDLDPDRTTGTLSISRQIGKSTSLSLLATVQFQRGLPAEPRAILTLTSFPSAGGQMASVSTVVTGSSPSADLSFRSGDRQGTPSFFLSASGLPAGQDDGLAAAAGVQYTGNLFEGSLSDSLFFRRGASFGQNRLSVEAGIALVGLDGTVSLSRPISDSFAVVIPQENMEHERVVVNPDGEDPVVSQGGVGYGVISQLKSYAAAPITLDAPEAPLDSGIADVDRVLVPTYRSGIAVRVGTKATVTAQGTLRFEDGEAIALQAAEIVPRGSPSTSPLEVFTDEDGVFQAYGLTPGRYELRLSADEAVREPITIPPDASGWYELGTLQLAIQKGDIP